MQAVRAFRAVAVAEAFSWLALIVAAVIKRTNDISLGVKILGPIHGVLFIAYVVLALTVRVRLRWTAKSLAIVLVDSVLPAGGFIVARRDDLRPIPAPD